MPKSPAHHSIRIGSSAASSQPDQSDQAWARWQWHVDHGNIGTGPGTTAEQLARHAHNDQVLCGPRVPRIWEE